MAYKVTTDANGKPTLQDVVTPAITQEQLNAEAVYAKAAATNPMEAARIKAAAKGNIASPGVFATLSKLGVDPKSTTAQNISTLDAMTKEQRNAINALANIQSQKAQNPSFFGSIKNTIYSLGKGAVRTVTLAGTAIPEWMNATFRTGIATGAQNALQFGAAGVTKSETKVPVEKVPTAASQTVLGQIVMSNLKNKSILPKLDLGSGFFPSEDTGEGHAARQASLATAKLPVKDSNGKIIGYRPITMTGDAWSTILTLGHPETAAGTVVSALGELYSGFMFDGQLGYANEIARLKKAQKAAVTSGAIKEAAKIEEAIKNLAAKEDAKNAAIQEFLNVEPQKAAEQIAKNKELAANARLAWTGRAEDAIASSKSVKAATYKLDEALTRNQAIKDETARIAKELNDLTATIKAPNQLNRAESALNKANKALADGKAMVAEGKYPQWMAKVPELEAAVKAAADKVEQLRAVVGEGKVVDQAKVDELKSALNDARLKEKYSNQEVKEMNKLVAERSRTEKIASLAREGAYKAYANQRSKIQDAVDLLKDTTATKEQKLRAVADAYEEMANIKDANGKLDINYGLIKDFLTNGHSSVVYNKLADITDWKEIWRLSKKKLSVEQSKLIADAKTETEIIDALAPFLIKNGVQGGTFAAGRIERMAASISEKLSNLGGTIDRVAALPGVRNLVGVASAVQRRLPYHEKVANLFNKFSNASEKIYNYTAHQYGTKLRGGVMVNIHDTEAVLDAVDNFGRGVGLEKKTLDAILDKIASETDASLRGYTASVDLLNTVIKQFGEKIPARYQKAFDDATTAFKASKENMSLYWANQHISGSNIEFITMGNQKINLAGPHLESELLNSAIFIPPATEFLDMMTRTAKYATLGKLRDVSDTIISDYWKKMVLVRPAFVIRNIAEEQLRVFGTGHISFFNHPGQAFAMWFGDKDGTAFQKMLSRHDKYKNTIFDESFDSGDEFANIADEASGRAVKNSYIDMFNDDISNAYGDRAFKAMAFKNVGSAEFGSERFFDGVTNQIRIMHSSEFGRVVAGYTPPSVAAAIKNGVKREDAVIDYFFSGEGRKTVDKLAASKNETVSNWLKTRDGLREYLYTGKSLNPDGTIQDASVLARIKQATGNNRSLVEMISHGKTKIGDVEFKIPSAEDEAFKQVKGLKNIKPEHWKSQKAKFLEAQEELARKIEKAFPEGEMWRGTKVPVPSKNLAYLEANRKGVNRFVDYFFDVSTRLEKQSTFGPEFRQAYWDAINEVAGALNAEGKAKLMSMAEESLKPLTFKGKNVGENHPIWNAFNKATGDGPMTLADAHTYADTYARRHVKELFYNASERRLVFHQLRLIGPFMNAWEDTIRKWSEIGMDNPQQVYKGIKAMNWLESPESSAIYQLTDARDYYDPNQGFFFNDPQQGRMFYVPFAGTVMSKLAGIASGVTYAGAPIAFSANPMSFNFALGAGSILPGVGPGVTLPISVIDSFNKGFIDNLPPDIRNWMFPFGPTDIKRGPIAFLPGNWQKIIGGFTGDDSTYSNTFKPVMQYIATGGDLNLDNPDDQAELVQKTDRFARWFSIMRGFTGLFSPAALVSQGVAKDATGGVALQSALYNDFKTILEMNNNDWNAGVHDFLNMYGANAVFAMISASAGNGPSNWDSYQFVVDNPDVANKYADIWGFVYPGGGLSREMYRWNVVHGLKTKLTPQEILDKANGQRFYAAKDAIIKQVAAGTLDKQGYRDATNALRDAFGGGPKNTSDSNKFQRQMSQIRNLLDDSRFVGVPSLEGLYNYMLVRDAVLAKIGKNANQTLKGAGADVEQARAILSEQAVNIVRAHPEFQAMYYEFFAKELEGN